MTLGKDQIAALAAEFWQAEQTGGAVANPSRRFDGFGWGDARAVARTVDELRIADGRRPVGYKLGWTSAAMREALGIDQPNWGTLWDYQIQGLVIDVSTLRHPKVEPELVYRCGADLYGPDVDQAAVLAAASGWALGLEMVHPRYDDYEFTWLDNTADNSSSQAVVMSAFSDLGRDPAEVEIEFASGSDIRSGSAAAAMGSPAEAVAWLVRSLHHEDRGLASGDLVFTGGLAAPFDVESGNQFTLRAVGGSGLAPIEVAVVSAS